MNTKVDRAMQASSIHESGKRLEKLILLKDFVANQRPNMDRFLYELKHTE